MNKNLKTFAALSLVPLFIGVIIGYGINISEAQVGGNPLTQKQIGAKAPKSYGYATQNLVCGDSLCSPPTPSFDVEEEHDITLIDEHDENTPTTKLIGISKVKSGSPNKAQGVTYIITYQVASGKTNLENIHVHVSSDIETSDYVISSLDSYKTSKNVVRIKALDPDSLDGGITGYSLAPSTFDARDPNRQLQD